MKSSKKLSNLFLVLFAFGCTNTFAQATWIPAPSGFNAPVLAMANYNGELYIGKSNVAQPDEISKWNGTDLSDVGAGTNGPVGAFAIFNNDLYVGGGFTTAGGIVASDVAKWNGNSWAAVGTQLDNFSINALAVYNGELYAGGYAINNTQTAASAFTLAKWDGTNWVNVGTGIQGGDVYAMTVYNNELYVSGTFTGAGGVTVPHIAKWNGSTWSDVGLGSPISAPTTGTAIYTLAVYNGELYAGGDFTMVRGSSANGIAKWNGTDWSKVGTSFSGADNTVRSLATYNNELYVGGAFSKVNGIAANHIAKWDGTIWSALDNGVGAVNDPNEQVFCIAAYNNNIYAAGSFTTAGGQSATNIAKWSATANVTQLSANNSDIKIYPNPATQNAVIELNTIGNTNATIEMYDVTGRKITDIYKGQLKPGTHYYPVKDLQTFIPGIYTVIVSSGDKISIAKLLKN